MYQIYEELDKNQQMTYLSKYVKPREITEEVKKINEQFIQILQNSYFILLKDNIYNKFIIELTSLLNNFHNSGKSLENFLKSNNTFQMFVSKHKKYSNSFKNLNDRIKKYNPYHKNSDYLITIALIDTLKKYQNYIKEKNIKMDAFKYKDEYGCECECSLLTKSELVEEGMPMVLGGITPCCLNIGATGGNFSLYSILDPNANFITIRQNGKIISHALIWLSKDKKSIVIDSIDPTEEEIFKSYSSRGDDKYEIDDQKYEYIIRVYNQIASELLKNNKNINQVNISLGGNTMTAIGIINGKQYKKSNIFEQNINEEEITKKKKEIMDLTGWSETSSAEPINGDKFFMNNSDIHGITFLNQLKMKEQKISNKKLINVFVA